MQERKSILYSMERLWAMASLVDKSSMEGGKATRERTGMGLDNIPATGGVKVAFEDRLAIFGLD